MAVIVCPECGSENIMCIETGIEIKSISFSPSELNGDCYICGDCDERFITGLGLDSKNWGVPSYGL